MLFWVLVALALLALAAIFFMLFRSLWKSILSAIGIVFAMLLILSVMVFFDAKNFAEKSKGPGQLFILEENGRMLAGVKDLLVQDDGEGKESKKILANEEFQRYSSLYEKKDYNGMLDNNYKVFFVDMEAFASLTDDDLKEYGAFTKESISKILMSEDAVGAYVDDIVKNSGIAEEQQAFLREKLIMESPEEVEFRSTMFMMLLAASLKSKGPLFIAMQYRKGNIKAYPETIFFKALNVMPEALFSRLQDSAMQPAQKNKQE